MRVDRSKDVPLDIVNLMAKIYGQFVYISKDKKDIPKTQLQNRSEIDKNK